MQRIFRNNISFLSFTFSGNLTIARIDTQEKYEYDPPEQHLVQKNDIFCTWALKRVRTRQGLFQSQLMYFRTVCDQVLAGKQQI